VVAAAVMGDDDIYYRGGAMPIIISPIVGEASKKNELFQELF
jgi:hypothetical protein